MKWACTKFLAALCLLVVGTFALIHQELHFRGKEIQLVSNLRAFEVNFREIAYDLPLQLQDEVFNEHGQLAIGGEVDGETFREMYERVLRQRRRSPWPVTIAMLMASAFLVLSVLEFVRNLPNRDEE